ncbi:hypothetical protein CWE07_08505 [Aliidiomarina maris]|uniref:Uncharacterized protein n=1 Tax=Aliidiomarina maris TaxID=531312 RepID=A0A327WW63_9GAMM|nr:hypothetical protein B0I24_106160 [Aliidiomarina maris]RUO24697.1 hypothetical protein CWE07_08505 [Aliidiomarina maris]
MCSANATDDYIPEIGAECRFDNFEGFGVLQASFGYGSDRDGENFHFDLCQACFERLVDTVENLRTAHGVRA